MLIQSSLIRMKTILMHSLFIFDTLMIHVAILIQSSFIRMKQYWCTYISYWIHSWFMWQYWHIRHTYECNNTDAFIFHIWHMHHSYGFIHTSFIWQHETCMNAFCVIQDTTHSCECTLAPKRCVALYKQSWLCLIRDTTHSCECALAPKRYAAQSVALYSSHDSSDAVRHSLCTLVNEAQVCLQVCLCACLCLYFCHCLCLCISCFLSLVCFFFWAIECIRIWTKNAYARERSTQNQCRWKSWGCVPREGRARSSWVIWISLSNYALNAWRSICTWVCVRLICMRVHKFACGHTNLHAHTLHTYVNYLCAFAFLYKPYIVILYCHHFWPNDWKLYCYNFWLNDWKYACMRVCCTPNFLYMCVRIPNCTHAYIAYAWELHSCVWISLPILYE